MPELCTEGASRSMVCRILGLSRSTAYYQARVNENKAIKTAITAVAGQYPTYGRRRITHELRRAPHTLHANHKQIGRLMADLGLTKPPRKWRVRTTNSEHPHPRYYNLVKNLKVTHPDQVWVSDITFVRLGHGFIYLAVIMDVYTRAIRGWNLSRSLDQRLSLAALEMALAEHTPEIHHSDQGLHYAAEAYVTMLKQHRVRISMAEVGQPEQNGYAERLMRTIKEEEVALADYRSFTDAWNEIKWFIEDVYMTKRIHSALKYVTPAEFENAWQAELSAATP
jgi:putative transposase